MSEAKDERFVIIHGHFYQPPREDPWTGLLERQPSAEPRHDWNERINLECYAANAAARTLNTQGLITDIINNYAHISFNFGPTLLTWLEREDPETYARILAADRISQTENDGHGNAIAQVYNHVILPLATQRDRLTQIRWGLDDFFARFGRPAEGIWLAETAVNTATVEDLLACNVRFIILSPTQAQAVRDSAEDTWRDVANNSIDTSEPYWVVTPHGRLAVFFYDMDVSKSVGFEHLLTDAGTFRDRLLAAMATTPPRPMVNIATDGESYGHHEPWADMCLAHLIADNQAHHHFRLTNYGWYLANFPPRREVLLKAGKNQLGTAWSCAHGLGRWMEDCGCGGEGEWQQAWRAPLRESLDLLRDEINNVCEPLAAELFFDFWPARDAYVELLLDSSPVTLARFCDAHLRNAADDAAKSLALTLLEAQRFALYMQTSCAWFFSEISGLEAVQCMRYAARALQLLADRLDPEVKENFLAILERAPSNIPRFGNGLRVWQELVEPYLFEAARLVAQHALEQFVGGAEASRDAGQYELKLSETWQIQNAGDTVNGAVANLRQRYQSGEQRFLVYVRRGSPLEVDAFVKPFHDPEVRHYLDRQLAGKTRDQIRAILADWFPRSYGIRDLRRDSQERLATILFHDSFREMHALRSLKLDEHLELVEFYGRLHLDIPLVERANLEATFNNEIARQLEILEQEGEHESFDFERVSRLLTAAERTGLKINRRAVADLFALKIEAKLAAYLANPNAPAVAELSSLIAFTNRFGLRDGRRRTENRVFELLRGEVHDLLQDHARGEHDLKRASELIRLGGELGIQVEPLRRRFDERTRGDHSHVWDRDVPPVRYAG